MTSNEMKVENFAAKNVWSSSFHKEMDCMVNYSLYSHLQQTGLANESITNAAVSRGQ